LWGTIVNSTAILAGALLGTLIKRGFTRKVRGIGAALILLASLIAVIFSVFIKPSYLLVILAAGAAAELIWALLGFTLRKGLPEAYSNVIMQGIGLSVVIIGIDSSFKSENMLLVIMSLVIGGIIGQAAKIEKRLDSLGEMAQACFGGNGSSTFSQGFVNASLIFCVGAMAIVGSLDAGLRGDYMTLYAKSMLDGITSMVLSTTLGIGVAFSAVAVFIYQGIITVASGALYPLLSDVVINEMSAVGGILIMGIGLSMLGIKKFNIGNLLPAIFVPLAYFPLAGLIGDLMAALVGR
jgi:uncharacterized membrane protein YqgA involved in biofilm formation